MSDAVTTPSGLKYEVLKEGTGETPKAGQNCNRSLYGYFRRWDQI